MTTRPSRTMGCWIVPITLGILSVWCSGAIAQSLKSLAQIPTNPTDHSILESLAVNGQPWGFASVKIPVGYIEPGVTLRVLVQDEQGRVFYPSVVTEAMPVPRREAPRAPERRIGRGVLIEKLRAAIRSGRDAIQPPQLAHITFAYRGNEPLRIRVLGDVEISFEIATLSDQPSVHADLRSVWWQNYGRQAQEQLQAGDYPPLFQNYLVSMLSGRMRLPMPELREKQEKEAMLQEPLSTLALLAGTETMRAEQMRACMQPPDAEDVRLVPTPLPPAWSEGAPPPAPSDLPVESIANQVPPECFYLRFGSFSNFLWFKEAGESRGGDLAQAAMLRGFNYDTNSRMERMLNTKTTAIAKLFGDSIIQDMAIIGRDIYLQEGPTLGVLFEAKNIDLLRTSMSADRAAALSQWKAQGIQLETIKIAGRDASFLHTPDNTVRSFMVEHQKYLLLTTSLHLAERFLQIADGDRSMASSPHFRFARVLMPIENQYSLFAYLSPEFFQSLVAPNYQIELQRRLKAIAYLEMAEMATHVAKAEGHTASTIDDLIKADFLPEWYEQRPDGARVLKTANGWVDSLRGARGSFLPIADVGLAEVTFDEAHRYAKQAEFYRNDWKQTDPLVVGVRRFANPDRDDVERLAVEAYVAPFGRDKYGWMSSMLAPPVDSEIQLPQDDVANLQVHLAGSDFGRASVPNHVLFVGVKDLEPPQPGELKGLIQILRTLKQTPAYVGAWPLPGYLDRLPLGMGGGPPDALGFSKLLIGLWRWQGGGFSILSFDRSILEQCLSRLAIVPASDPAQVRLNVRDLAGSRLSSWVNTFWYRKGLETSRGNALLLDAIHQQLHVEPDESLTVVERILDCKLQCALGGQYQLAPNGVWTSSHWPTMVNSKSAIPPEGYQAPWLDWFRGGQAHLTQLPDRLILIAQLDLQKLKQIESKANDEKSPLPAMDFNLFHLPFQLMNGDKKADSAPKSESPERRKF